MRLDAPLYLLGFGALGLKMRDLALGTETAWWSKGWALYVLLLLFVLLSLIGLESAIDLILIVIGLVSAVAAGAIVAWLWRRVLGPAAREHGGWLSLLALILLGVLVWRHHHTAIALLGALQDLLGQVLQVLFREKIRRLSDIGLELAVAVLVFSLFLWLILYAVRGVLGHLRDCSRELWRFASALAASLGLRRPVIAGSASTTAELQPMETSVPSRLWVWLLRSIDGLCYATLTVAIALPLFIVLHDAYPRDGIWPEIRSWFIADSRPTLDAEMAQGPQVNPFLWQAALDYVADIPVAVTHSSQGFIRTNWYSAPEGPGVRTQMSIRIAQELSLSAVQITLRRQEKRLFGVWVERDWTFQEERKQLQKEAQQIQKELLMRAEEFAQQVQVP